MRLLGEVISSPFLSRNKVVIDLPLLGSGIDPDCTAEDEPRNVSIVTPRYTFMQFFN